MSARRIAILCASLLLGLVTQGHARADGTLVYLQPQDVTSLDPGDGGDIPSVNVHMHLYERLIRPKIGGGYEPGLATAWEVDADRKTWTLTLRSGVRFHDGTPFDAEAVRVNVDRLVKDKLRYGHYFSSIIDHVEVAGPNRVRIVTKFPTLLLENRLALEWAGMVSPTALRKYGKDIRVHPVGTGPFTFKEWVPGRHLILLRNEDYWGTKPSVDAIEFRPIKEPSTRVVMIETGQADVALAIPSSEVPRLRRHKDVELRVDDGQRIVYIAFNTKVKPFDDPRVRLALNHAVDKAAIVEHVLGGFGRTMDSPLAPSIWGYHKVGVIPFDPAKARRLLAEAGYPGGFETVLYQTQGSYFMDQEVAQVVQAQLAALGVKMKIVQLEWSGLLSALTRPGDELAVTPGEPIPMYALSWSGATNDAEIVVNALLSDEGFPPSGYNAGRYSNAEVNDIARRASRTISAEERAKLYRRAQQIIMADAPWLFLHVEKQITAVRKGVEGLRVWPSTRVDATAARK